MCERVQLLIYRMAVSEECVSDCSGATAGGERAALAPRVQQCWDVAAQPGSQHAAFRSGFDQQVLVTTWDLDLRSQSWQETVAFASFLTPGQ